jgi:hypothetical protein
VFKGRLTFRYADREEVFEAGDAFYAPPGHVPVQNEPGTEYLRFSPSEELRRTSETIMENIQALQGSLTLTRRRGPRRTPRAEPVLHREEARGAPAGGLDLRVDVLGVGADGLGRDGQALGDLLVGQARARAAAGPRSRAG